MDWSQVLFTAITTLFGIVSAVSIFILQSVIKDNRELKKKSIEEINNKEVAIEKAMVLLLRNALIDSHDRIMKNGSFTIEEYEDWLTAFNAYHALVDHDGVDYLKKDIDNLKMEN